MKYNDETFGRAEAVFNKLGGPTGVDRFLAGELVVVEENPPKTLTWLEAEEKAYGLMGMADEYAKFRKESGGKEIAIRWVLHIVKGISYAKIISALKKSGSGFWSYYDNLEAKVTHNDRDANRGGSYAQTFLAVVEADPENAGKSANKLKEEKHRGITLMERLFLELVYFLMTGEHLDVINITLCTGSRFAGDSVPSVNWYSDSQEVRVSGYRPDYSSDSLRSRSAVSLPA